MSELIYCLRIWAGPGIRRALGRARERLRRRQQTLRRPVLPPCPPYARRPLPEHVTARLRPIDGHELALARPYLWVQKGADGE